MLTRFLVSFCPFYYRFAAERNLARHFCRFQAIGYLRAFAANVSALRREYASDGFGHRFPLAYALRDTFTCGDNPFILTDLASYYIMQRDRTH